MTVSKEKFDLHFSDSAERTGFVASQTGSFVNHHAPIVRELTQNALDASANEKNSEGMAELCFTIADISTDEIPAIDTYRRVITQAIKDHTKKGFAVKDKAVAENISNVAKRDTQTVLFIRDNGIGFNPERMDAILSDGMTKGSEGRRGSFGLGHLQAFKCSDLRFVLYAGKHKEGSKIKECSSGQAILAAHQFSNKNLKSSMGELLTKEKPLDLFAFAPYLTISPEILKSQLEQIKKTGSVIAILGFNFFGKDKRTDTGQAIIESCASNFLPAIRDGELSVSVKSEGNEAWEVSLGQEEVEATIRQMAHKKTSGHSKIISGSKANSVLDVLNDKNAKKTKINGCEIMLAPSDDGRSKVFLFRNGMHITDDINEFRQKFVECKPFNAVILVNEDPAHSLVRQAEDPLHISLNSQQFVEIDLDKKDKYKDMLKKIKEWIIETAGKIETRERFSSNIFTINQTSESLFKVSSGGAPPFLSSEEEKAPKAKKQNEKKPSKPPKATLDEQEDTPAKGRRVVARSSIEINGGDDHANEVEVFFKFNEHIDGDVGVSIYLNSGTDISCEKPLHKRWISLKEGKYKFTEGIGKEICIPQEEAMNLKSLKIELGEAVPKDAVLVPQFSNRTISEK